MANIKEREMESPEATVVITYEEGVTKVPGRV